ncbi:MAG TPA: hypothetical protein PKM61_04715 [bacterium]|uniref:Cryptic beta-D-galactosidase subunit alpha n=1 Tax=candidate division TA06 bacterium ADurb.Bin417 TaxID=1852828 RepID=A0A1V5MI53_UNCT6|nr:MAG: cryptic beta-D-galactosidase subunit alpha [candidate division TA06 bacterium ADurb.Bin417]HNS48811.1 hypothetical protein [bacterium]
MKRKTLAILMAVLLLTAGSRAGAQEAAPDPTIKVKTIPIIFSSFRQKRLQVFFMVENSSGRSRELTVRPKLTDFKTSQPVSLGAAPKISLPAGFDGETGFTIPADGLKTWSHWDPQLYLLDLELEENGKPVGRLPQVRFGYREAWTEKGNFYLNGKKLFLFGGNHDGRRNEKEMQFAKMAHFNADTVRGDFFVAQQKTLDLADRNGHYVFGAFLAFDPGDRANLYKIGNHPCIIGYALDSGEVTAPHGHPMQIGAVVPPEVQAADPTYKLVRELNQKDPGRLYGPYVRGHGGNFRSLMWDLGWGVPVQSQEEWLSFWSQNREKVEPFFPQEFAFVRLGANMARLDRHFGQSAIVEHMSRYLGDEAYRQFDTSMIVSYTPGSKLPDTEPKSNFFYLVKNYMYTRILPVWRVYGLGGALLHVDGHPQGLPTRDGKLTPLGETYRRVADEVYLFLAGPKSDFVSKDHGFYPGETIAKSAILINDSVGPVKAEIEWRAADARGKTVASGKQALSVGQGEVGFLPIEFKAPAVKTRTLFKISALGRDDTGRTHQPADLEIRVYPRTTFAGRGKSLLLIDDSGETRALLEKMGLKADLVSVDTGRLQETAAKLAAGRLLVIGRNAYPAAAKLFAALPVQDYLRRGLNLVVLEQMNRHALGLKLENTGSRDIFIRAADSPLLAGLENRDLSEWRGESRRLPSYPSFDTESLWWYAGYSYQGQMNAFRQRRAWQWSNKATVATFTYEKPQLGNFRVLLDGGFDLLYTPLVEFQAGRGRILVNSLDLVDHYGSDPVATLLLERILTEYDRPGGRTPAPVGVLSDGAAAQLDAFSVETVRGLTGPVIFLTPADLDQLTEARQKELRAFVQGGGSLLASVLTPEQAARLPVRPDLEDRELFNPDLPADPAFSGLGAGDLFVRAPHKFAAITGIEGAAAARISRSGLAAVADLGKGKVVLLQVAADRFKEAEDFWGRSKIIRLYATVLNNLGGRSRVEPDLAAIGGWGLVNEWLPGYADRVPKRAPKVQESNLYQQPTLDWDPDAHVAF